MKKYIISAISIILIVVATIIIKARKKKQMFGLGEADKLTNPPKISIIYSKNERKLEKLGSSNDAYEVLKKIWSNQMETREEVVVLFLNRANNVLGFHKLSVGGITETIVDLRLIFAIALKSLAVSVVLAHNHVSGGLKPSNADKDITQKVKKAGEMLKIKLLDHIIITKSGYFSFADEGEL